MVDRANFFWGGSAFYRVVCWIRAGREGLTAIWLIDGARPYAFVLLMRKPFLASKPMLEAAGSAAFGVPYDGSDPMYFVVQEGATMMKAGPYLIHVLHKWGASLGATEDDTETGASLLPEPQRAMWREQPAWASVDLWNEDVPEGQAFHVLSSLVLRLTDERCCGIWVSSQARFLPNDGTAELELVKLQRP